MAEQDPYTRKLVTTNYYADKSILSARVVAVLRGELENRNLELIPNLLESLSKAKYTSLSSPTRSLLPAKRYRGLLT